MFFDFTSAGACGSEPRPAQLEGHRHRLLRDRRDPAVRLRRRGRPHPGGRGRGRGREALRGQPPGGREVQAQEVQRVMDLGWVPF